MTVASSWRCLRCASTCSGVGPSPPPPPSMRRPPLSSRRCQLPPPPPSPQSSNLLGRRSGVGAVSRSSSPSCSPSCMSTCHPSPAGAASGARAGGGWRALGAGTACTPCQQLAQIRSQGEVTAQPTHPPWAMRSNPEMNSLRCSKKGSTAPSIVRPNGLPSNSDPHPWKSCEGRGQPRGRQSAPGRSQRGPPAAPAASPPHMPPHPSMLSHLHRAPPTRLHRAVQRGAHQG